MDTELRRAKATIHPFPPGGRAARRKPPEHPRTDKPATMPGGRAWYHDLAIRDADAAREPEPRS